MTARQRYIPLVIAAAIFSAPLVALAEPATQPASVSLHWLDSLDAGYMQSQRTRRPILVFAGADWVAGSRQQWAELQLPPIAGMLDDWTLVHLDYDANKSAERTLAIVAPPALRILDADGKPIASQDGPLDADRLAAWLANAPKSASDAQGVPANTAEALAHLGDSDPAARELAIRQLRADGGAAPTVVEMLKAGALSQRLSAMELLQGWNAPVGALDPWNPRTITADRLAALRTWARAHSATTRPAAMDSSTMAEELDALLAAPTDAEARTVRERLVVAGDALLPMVVVRLANRPSSAARARLLALRYRLVATDRLAAAWPGGFDRLASADIGVRREAMAELATAVDGNDHRLLRELFTDDDPFIRGQSLKLLRQVGGAATGHDLIGLLADPDKNVRAAVLSTLADSPDPSLTPDLLRYAAKETDEDLLVNVVHVLQATPGATAFDGLVGMLTNSHWRVRGEAAESMLGKLSENTNEDPELTDDRKAAGIAALVKQLDDPDGYVESRSANTLIRHDFDGNAAPLIASATRHPAVARDVLRALSNPAYGNYLPQVRALSKSGHADVRSAAIMAIAHIAPDECGAEITAALHDPDPAVRGAGVQAVVAAMNEMFTGIANGTSPDKDQWPEKFREGTVRPAWIAGIAGDLKKALGDPQSATYAAIALAGLGQDDVAMPVLIESAERPQSQLDAAEAMRWLPTNERLRLYDTLMSAAPHRAATFLRELSAVPDPKAAQRVWDLLGTPAGQSLIAPAHNALVGLYLGVSQYYEIRNASDDRKSAAVELLRKKVAEGTDVQRIVALALMQEAAPDQAVAYAQAMAKDAHLSDELRSDAMRVLMMSQDQDASLATAVSGMNDPVLSIVAMQYLSAGSEVIEFIRGPIYLQPTSNAQFNQYQHDQNPVTISAPTGLTDAPVRAVLKNALATGQVDRAGYAEYLLVLLGDKSQLPKLITVAREHNFQSPWDQLTFKAIAKTDGPAQIPVLQELYRKYKQDQSYELPEFYWTIRSMTGPEILKFRKMMRDQIGMDNLR